MSATRIRGRRNPATIRQKLEPKDLQAIEQALETLRTYSPDEVRAQLKCWSLQELAAMVGVSIKFVRAAIDAGELRCRTLGGRTRRVRHADAIAWLESPSFDVVPS